MQDIQQNFGGRLRGVNDSESFLWIITEHRLRIGFVNLQSTLDHFLIGIIEPVVLQSAFLQSIKERLAIRAGKMKHPVQAG